MSMESAMSTPLSLTWQTTAPDHIRLLAEECIQDHAAILPPEVRAIELRLDLFPGLRLPGPPGPPALFSNLDAPYELTLWDDGTHYPLEVIRSAIVRAMVDLTFQERAEAVAPVVTAILRNIPHTSNYPMPKEGVDGLASIFQQYARNLLEPLLDVLVEEIGMMKGELPHIPFWERDGIPGGTAIAAMFRYEFDPVQDGPPEFREWLAAQESENGSES
jgi:hypothetical protein